MTVMKKEEVKEEYWRIREAEEVNADYGGMVQPNYCSPIYTSLINAHY